MDNPQYYQPLSHALFAPQIPSRGSPPPPHPYTPHPQTAVTGAAASTHREEEEEEEEDDEVVEEELDHHNERGDAAHAQPPQAAPHTQAGTSGLPNATVTTFKQDMSAQQAAADAEAEKRRPGRPRGSRNRKPRAQTVSASKAPANTQHPGFYQYPPAPTSSGLNQNQQFYEFQWRALNLCSEFYNAAEELVKAASPIVIAQCYQMGPSTKIDPLALIAEAKRVCDNLLANPSQLVGSPPPAIYSAMPSYPQMAPPSTPGLPASASAMSGSGPIITNPQSFVMSLGAPMAGSSAPYYPPMYAAAPGSRYPTAPYYSYPPQPTGYYASPPMANSASVSAAPAPVTSIAAPPHTPTPSSASGTLTTFNAATGTTAPGGQQGTWSEEETERLRKLAEQSRELGGPQNKGEIEWDWVVTQWGNGRTRHQILLKATSMGLKESTTRGTKRRREHEPDNHAGSPTAKATPTGPPAVGTASPAQSSSTSAPASAVASPVVQPQRPTAAQQVTTPTIAPARTSISSGSTAAAPTAPPATAPITTNLPWPMPTVAANTSPVLTPLTPSSAQADQQRGNYYRPRPTQTTTSYGAAAAANSSTVTSRPTSSHGSAATHQYMFRPNGTPDTRRPNGS